MPAKILIVDDEPSARLTLKNLLRPEGYTLQFANDGAAGLAEARLWQPDVILADVMMPVMDGLELCRQIRADAALSQVPIILTTALDDRQAKVRGLEAGADDFITKPIDSVELRARLRTLTKLDRFRKLNEEQSKLEQTHRKLLQANEALGASEERFRSFIEQSSDGFLLTDEQGIIIEWNLALMQITGLTHDQALGMPLWDIPVQMVASEYSATLDMEQFKQVLGNMLQTGQSPLFGQSNDATIRTRDGEIKVIQHTAFPIRITQGYCLGAVVRDITKHKQMEQTLEAEAVRRRILFDESPDGILVIDQQTAGFVEFNTAAHTQLGYSREEFAQLHIFDIEAQETADETRAHIGEVIQNGKSDFETLQYTKQGERRNIHVTAQIVKIMRQPVYYCTWRDITERKLAEEKLRESEEQYRFLVDNTSDFIARFDRNGVVLFASGASYRFNGYAPDEIVHTSAFERIHPEDRDMVRGKLKRVLETGAEGKVEYRIRRKTGEDIWVEAVGRCVSSSTGESEVVVVQRDITERKRAEEELRLSQARYRSLVETQSDLVSRSDLTGRLTFVNDAYCRVVGLAREVLLGRQFQEFVHPDDLPALQVATQILCAAPYRQYIEDRLLTPDGARWFGWQSSAILDENKSVVEFQGVGRDITERKQAEAALRESEERYRSMLDNMMEGCQIISSDWRYLYVNSAVAQQGRYSCDELQGRTMMEMYPGIESTAMFAVLRDCMENHVTRRIENEFIYADGSPGWFDLSIVPVPEGIFILSVDITERKRALAELDRMEKRYRAMIEYAPDGIVLINADGKFKYASPSVERVFGYTHEDLPNCDSVGMTHPEDLAMVLSELTKLLNDPSYIPTLQYRFRHKSGEWRWIESTFSNLLTLPSVESIIINFRDIHERKLAEDKLHQSEERIRLAIETTHLGIWEWNLKTNQVRWNAEMFRLYGLPPSAEGMVDYTDWASALEAGTLAGQEVILQDTSRHHGQGQREFQIRRKDTGQVHSIYAVETIRLDPSGEPVWMVGTNIDITERKQAEAALRESEEKYRGLMESLDSVVCLVDYEGCVLYLNEVAARDLGGVSEDFIGKTLAELFPEPAATRQLQSVRQTIQADHGIIQEQITFVQGQPRWYRASFQPIHDATGRVVSALVNATDIHDLKTAQQRLEELNRTLEERVRQRTAEVQDLYDNAPAGYHSLDTNGNVVMINQTQLNWLGCTRDELLGRPATEFLTPASVAMFQAHLPILIQHGRVNDLEFEMICKGGSIIPVMLSATAIYDEQGRFVMSRSTVSDITERKKAEQALREGEARYRSIFENSLNGILINDPASGKIIDANPAACQMWGGTKEELCGVERGAWVDATDPRLPRILEERARTGRFSGEQSYRHKDGSSYPVEVSSTISTAPTGELIANTFFTDIALRKKAEETLRQANFELERALRMKDEFLATMSHELRTPLNAILGLSETLHEQILGPLNEKQIQSLATIEASGHHLLELINDILDLSKIEAGALTLTLSPVSAKSLCDASLLFVREAARKKKIKLFSTLDADIQMISVDERRAKQMLVNLLSNAVKFTPEGGRVGLEMVGDRQARTVCFTVWDTGIGISGEGMARLFKPFVQLDSSLSRRYEGTGLGLSLVARMAAMHGGSVTVESELGKGSRFTITLPWTEAPQVDEPACSGVPAPTTPETCGMVGTNTPVPLILVVDDNETTIFTLSTYLEAKGYRLAIARNGREALARVRAEPPALILMDLQMPDMDGLEATRRLRNDSDPRLANVSIVVLTALAMPGDREKALAAGANEYMSKPVNLKQLVEMIEQVRQSP